MIRTIVIDDEYLARQRVLKLLEKHDGIHVLDEAKNGSEAVQKIEEHLPDLVFLDVQMPDFHGFDVIKKIKHKPYVVFTTAYDAYAIKAFDIHALDYLLKPIDEERFDASIKKIEKYFEVKKSSDFGNQLMMLVQDFQQPDDAFTHLVNITDRGREYQVSLEKVYFIEANGNYVNLHEKDLSHLYRSTMSAFAETLNPVDFMRIHRSIIVNKRYVEKCSYVNNNEYRFTMKNGKILYSGRSFKGIVQEYLS